MRIITLSGSKKPQKLTRFRFLHTRVKLAREKKIPWPYLLDPELIKIYIIHRYVYVYGYLRVSWKSGVGREESMISTYH